MRVPFPPARALRPVEARRPRILVVDDQEDIVVSLRDLLEESYGAEVAAASSGPDAIVRLRAQPFDLLITDYRMPGMDGVELMEQARAIRPGLRAILMTGFDRELLGRFGERLAGEQVLRKPLAPDEFLEAVGKRLRGAPSQA